MNPSAERIVFAAAELFRRQGFAATGLKAIATEAGLPIGSIYHHFPGGKTELGETVIRITGAGFQELVETIIDAGTNLVSGIDDAFAGAAATVEASDYADACPIATLALEIASTNEPMRQASDRAFTGWIDALTGRIEAAGCDRKTARATAISVLSLLEGAFLFSRASRSVEPLHAAGTSAVALVRAAISD
ncbi:MAG: TetR/AcrR family transcriptional regulator [Acidimicrobiales bacterium]|nr:TetR/AcrR family transcriptional regulator [Acidimicrobiales bacterium]